MTGRWVLIATVVLALLLLANTASATHFIVIDGARVYNKAILEYRDNTFCTTTDDGRNLGAEQARIAQTLNLEEGWNLLGYSVQYEPDCAKADIEVRYMRYGNTWWVAQVWIWNLQEVQRDGVRWWSQERFIIEINSDRYFPLSDWSKKLVLNHEWGHVIAALEDHPIASGDNPDLLMSYRWTRNTPAIIELAAVREHYLAARGAFPLAPTASLNYDNPFDSRATVLVQWGIANLREGDLVRVDGAPQIYYLSGGELRWITSPEVFVRYGFRWENVKVVNAVTLIPWARGDILR